MAKKMVCPLAASIAGQTSADDAELCPLAAGAMSPNVRPSFEATGAPQGPWLLVVGEAPGREEDETGRPFVGESGQVLRQALARAGFDVEREVGFANVVRCRPPNNKTPSARIATCCAADPHGGLLDTCRTLAVACQTPTVIMLTGNTPLRALARMTGVMKHNGTELSLPDTAPLRKAFAMDPRLEAGEHPPVIASVHPAFVVRNPTGNAVYLDAACQRARQVFERVAQGKPDPAAYRVPVDVWYPRTVADFDELMRRLEDVEASARKHGVLAFDVETSGLDPWTVHSEPVVHTIALATRRTEALVIPWVKNDAPSWTPEQTARLQGFLRRLLASPDYVKLAHNMKFDLKWLELHVLGDELLGLTDDPQANETTHPRYASLGLPHYVDTLLLHYLLASHESHKLDDLTMRYAPEYGRYWEGVQHTAKEQAKKRRRQEKRALTAMEKQAEKEGRVQYGLVPYAELAEYNARDVMVLVRLFEDHLLPEAQRWPEDLLRGAFARLLMPGVFTLKRMEAAGLVVDQEELLDALRRYARAEYDAEVVLGDSEDLALFSQQYLDGKPFNPGSVQQRRKLFYEHWGLEPPHLTGGGEGSTDKEAVEQLRRAKAFTPEQEKIVDAIQARAHARKIMSTYLTAVKPRIGRDGRLHPSFLLHGTVTGRLASRNPNMQNQPEALRKIYRSRFKDGLILSADYATLEARVIACFCKDDAFLQIFREGRDFHIMGAALMLGKDPGRAIKAGPNKDWGEVTKEDRQFAKGAVSFGLMYGRSAAALARDLDISQEEAEAIRDAYFDRVPRLREWIEQIQASARTNGYVRTPTGRVRYLPDIMARDHYLRAEAERQAVNTPVQGTASDMTLRALIRIDNELRRRGLRAVPVVTVHDQIGVDTPPEEAEEAATIMVALMEDTAEYDWALVPFEVELTAHPKWDGGK